MGIPDERGMFVLEIHDPGGVGRTSLNWNFLISSEDSWEGFGEINYFIDQSGT